MRSHSVRVRLLVLAITLAVIVVGLKVVLRLPGVPYNVSELFLDRGSTWRLTLFAVALLWIGAGPVLAAEWLARSRRPFLILPIAMIALAMVSRTLLKYSVTYESLDDILGTNNLYGLITHERIWGDFWQQALVSANAGDFVSYVERRVRYIALYSPLATCLTLGFLTRCKERRFPSIQVAWLAITAAAWVWLSTMIVVPWAATDNLTELISATGAFGLGGVPYLLLLIMLLAAHVTWLLAAGRSWRRWLIAVALSIGAIPLGWLLLGLGLEQHVQKYGLIFTAPQFLLGPDRQHTLGPGILFARWAVAQTACVTVMFAGAAIVAGVAGADRAGGQS